MKKAVVAGGVVGALLVVVVALVSVQSNAAESVLIRGIVLQNRDSNDEVNVSYTHVATAADKTKWLGLTCDVKLKDAARYRWQVERGELVKRRTTSYPTAGKEIVFKGTINSDCRAKASWVVQNYRVFKITGTLEGITLDSGFTDQGVLTVKVSKSVMRDVVPEKKFKETQFKAAGVEPIFRFNGTTDFTALGKSKLADEVTASQQTVVIEGEMINERLVASKVKEQ